jgi:hypothetical protein
MSKIDKPGMYPALSMEDYHSNCCIGPSVSASTLWRLLNECPAKYWDTSYLNPARVPEPPKKALDVGRAAHALVLGEPEFNRYFFVCPHDNLQSNPGKAWHAKWKEMVADGRETRTLVRAADFEIVQQMTAAQRRSPQVARAFKAGRPEVSLIWQDEETGVWVKTRPDWLPLDPSATFAIDYKTARSIRQRKLGRDAFDYGYHLGAALQYDGIQRIVLGGGRPLGIAHVCQEKTRPFLAELRLFDERQLNYGRVKYREALQLFKRCWDLHMLGAPLRTAWPGYTDTPQFFKAPYEIEKEMEELDGQYTAG